MPKRAEMKNWLTRKEIILFGAGNYARQFYVDFHNTIRIQYCLSNDSREKVFIVDGKEICPVLRAESAAIKENQMIVLCAKRYREMEIQLRDMGYQNGVHYIDSHMARLLLTDKKIALCYGVCYMRAIYDCLIKSEDFSKKYETFYWLEYRRMEPEEYEFFSFLLPLCDLFIYTACVSFHKAKRNQAYLSRLSKECRTISVPFIVFQGYHPRTEGKIGDENPYNVISVKTYYSGFIVPDCNINRFIDQGKPCREIQKIVGDIGFYQKSWLEKNYEDEMKKIALAERITDIRIGDFLSKNHGKERLFLNETHISNPVIIELAKRILSAAGFKRSLPDAVLKEKRLLYTTEVPLYPSVIEHLDLEVYKNKPAYRLFTFENETDVTFEEYVERYYEYCISMKQWIVKGYFPMGI